MQRRVILPITVLTDLVGILLDLEEQMLLLLDSVQLSAAVVRSLSGFHRSDPVPRHSVINLPLRRDSLL